MNEKEAVILMCERNNHTYSGSKICGSKLHYVSSGDTTLHYWNSSDAKGFDHKLALEYIADLLKRGETTGSVSVNFCEIMFELHEK